MSSSIWPLVWCDVMLSRADVGRCQWIGSAAIIVPEDDQCYAPYGYGYTPSITTEELFKMPFRHCAKAVNIVVPSFAVAVAYSSASFGRRSI